MRFASSRSAQLGAEEVQPITVAELRRRADEMCTCGRQDCCVHFRGGCEGGLTETSYAREGRLLSVNCLECENPVVCVALPDPDPAEPRTGGIFWSVARLDEMRCAECTHDQPDHPLVLQQSCHPHAGQHARFYKALNALEVLCARCERIVARIRLGDPKHSGGGLDA